MKYIITEEQFHKFVDSNKFAEEIRSLGPRKGGEELGLSSEEWEDLAFVDYKKMISYFIEKIVKPKFDSKYDKYKNPYKIKNYEIGFVWRRMNTSIEPEHISIIIDFETGSGNMRSLAKGRDEIYTDLYDFISSIYEPIPMYWSKGNMGFKLYVWMDRIISM